MNLFPACGVDSNEFKISIKEIKDKIERDKIILDTPINEITSITNPYFLLQPNKK